MPPVLSQQVNPVKSQQRSIQYKTDIDEQE